MAGTTSTICKLISVCFCNEIQITNEIRGFAKKTNAQTQFLCVCACLLVSKVLVCFGNNG